MGSLASSHRMEIKGEPARGESSLLMIERETADTDGPGTSGRPRKEKSVSLTFVPGLGVSTEVGGLVYLSSQASRNRLDQRRGPRCYSMERGNLGMERSRCSGLEST